jgi:hypothetical protein
MRSDGRGGGCGAVLILCTAQITDKEKGILKSDIMNVVSDFVPNVPATAVVRYSDRRRSLCETLSFNLH